MRLHYPVKARPSRKTVVVFSSLALLLFAAWGYVLGQRLWLVVERDALTETTTGDRWRHGNLMGTMVAISVDGSRHWCFAGGRWSRQGDEAVVAYDPDDPSRCREQAFLSRVSGEEITLAFLWTAGLLLVSVWPLWRAAKGARRARRSD